MIALDDVRRDDLALQLSGVGKRFGSNWVLQGVDFAVPRGSIIGLVGHNGAGKSTLMKIALGAYPPSAGSVTIGGTELTSARPEQARRLGVGMVLQERSLINTLTGLDNIFLNDEMTTPLHLLRRRRETAEAEGLLSGLGISLGVLRRTVNEMSAVERQIVEIAKAVRLAKTVLILDEPTAPLSHKEIDALFDVIRNAAATGIGIVLITHHLPEVFAVCERVVVLREGTVVMSSPTSATDINSVIDAMLGAKGIARTDSRQRDSERFASLPPVLTVDDLRAGARLEAGVALQVRPGEIVGVAGLAGSGRTTLLRVIAGDLRPTSGTMALHGRPYRPRAPYQAILARVFLIPEDRHADGLLASHSIGENIALPVLRRLRKGPFFSRSKARALGRRLMGVLGVRARDVDQVVGELSGGNQQKIVLAKALAAEADLLLLDEPTFGVDVGAARDLIEQVRRMANQGKGVLWVTSDLQELLQVSDVILVLADGGIRTHITAGEPGYTEANLVRSMQRRMINAEAV